MSNLQLVQRELDQLATKIPLCSGLLPADFGRKRDATLDALAAGASAILANNMANFQLWTGIQRELVSQIRREDEALGLEAPPLTWDALWKRVEKSVSPQDLQAYLWLVQAFLTDYGPRFFQHVAYRMATGGNVHASCRGPTGSGKSSCMIALMDWIRPIEAGQLVNHLAFDIHEIPTKLRRLGPGDTLLLDELVGSSGEGARTNQMLLANLEDTLRASQRNLIIATPAGTDHATMQVDLECIAWNRKRRFSLFLVWVDGVPMGVVALPWCKEAHYAEYSPWKLENVQRTLSGQFNDNEQTAKAVMGLFEDPRFVEYLFIGANKLKMADLNTGIVLFAPGMRTQAQVERMAKFGYDQLYAVQRMEQEYGPGDGFAAKFEFFFGVRPNPGFLKIASKCYDE